MHNRLADVAALQQYGDDRIASDVAYLHNNITAQNQVIRKLRKDVQYYAEVSMKADGVRVITVTPKPTESSGGASVYPIDWYGQGVTMAGTFMLPERLFSALLSFDPVSLKLYLTEDKDGVWETFVEPSNPNWRIGSIHSEVSPYQKSRNFAFWLGTYGGSVADGYRFGGTLGLGYKGWGVYGFGDRFGFGIGLQRTWRF